MNTRQSPLTIIILAAGKGTRMKSATPKLLHEIAGRPMIKWLLETAESLNPDKIIVVTGPDMDALDQTCRPHTTVTQAQQNGTGGAVKAALGALDNISGEILILLGDSPLITKETLETLINTRQDALSILAANVPDPTGYGRMVLHDDGTLDKIVEHKDANERERSITLINTGAFCIEAAALSHWLDKLDNNNAQGEFYITQLPEIIAAENRQTHVAVTNNPAETEGCNTRADLAALEYTAQTMLRQRAMDNGVTLQDPNTVYFCYDTVLGHDVVIEPNVYFGPKVTIESGVHIRAFSHIEGATIATGSSIGPFARLRPGTEIHESARIGNFVEIKKSQIGPGSKIGHLAYVGDCIMGREVNFSAGAITVNYDGHNKHQTHIGNHVMVGSDVSLVAPVTVDDHAFIAAGSTITKDVPAESLAIARDKTRIIDGWSKKRKSS